MDWAAFLSCVLVSCITPGPNTMISMSGGLQRGFRYTLRYSSGVFLGFLAVSLLAALAGALLYGFLPAAEPWLLALGAAYILYLAWRVWRSSPDAPDGGGAYRGVLSGVAMQFINVKGVLFALTAMASYVLPHFREPLAIALISTLMAACCFVCCCLWALFGSVFEGLYRRRTKAVNAVMALALAFCAVSLLL